MKRTWISALVVFAMVVPVQALGGELGYGYGYYGGNQGCQMTAANSIYSKDDEMQEIEDEIRDLKDERKDLKEDLKSERRKLERYTKYINDTLDEHWSSKALDHMSENYCCKQPSGVGSEQQQQQQGEDGGYSSKPPPATASYDFVSELPGVFDGTVEVNRAPASTGRAPANDQKQGQKESKTGNIISSPTGAPANGWHWVNGACKDSAGRKGSDSNCSAPSKPPEPPPTKPEPPPAKPPQPPAPKPPVPQPPAPQPPPVSTPIFIPPSGNGGGGMCIENPNARDEQGWYPAGVCQDGGKVDKRICTYPQYRKSGTNAANVAQCLDAISNYRKTKQSVSDKEARLSEIETQLQSLADAKKDRKREIKREIRDGEWEAGCPDGSCYGGGVQASGSRTNKTSLLIGAGLSILGGVGGYFLGKSMFNTAAKYNAMTGNPVDPYSGYAAVPYVAAGASLGYPFIANGLYGGAYGGVNGGMGCSPTMDNGGIWGNPGMGMGPGGMMNTGFGYGMPGMGMGYGMPGMGGMMGAMMGMPMGGMMGMPMGGMIGAGGMMGAMSGYPMGGMMGSMMGGAMGMPMGGMIGAGGMMGAMSGGFPMGGMMGSMMGAGGMMGMMSGGMMGMPMGGQMMGAMGGMGMDYQMQMMQMQMQQYQMYMGMQQRYMENAAAKMRIQQGLMGEYYSLMYRFQQLQSGSYGGIGGGIGIGVGYGSGYGSGYYPGSSYGGGYYGGGYGTGYAGGPVVIPAPGTGTGSTVAVPTATPITGR